MKSNQPVTNVFTLAMRRADMMESRIGGIAATTLRTVLPKIGPDR